ncbi:MBL fold metallo-hydrolase [Aldersonia sp. NBC_00410]|nr:MBL fold metallo-hydrolase [Aldersonia sp. NBC_00410]
MRFSFLGHNGFALGDQDSPVLIDAILFPRYGEEYTSSPVEIYPPRWIDRASVPTPAAVVISHEHSDHFHLPSLDLLPRNVPIVVGPTMIQTVVDCVESLGFEVVRVPFGQPAVFGDVLITLYPPGRGTVLWESRVSQVYARDAADPDASGLFLGIDALVSDTFIDDLDQGLVPPPAAVAVSNNAQVTPPGVLGSLGNLKEFYVRDKARPKALGYSPFAGLDIVYELLDGTLRSAEGFADSHFLICGGGFLKDYEQMGPFPFSEQKQVAAAAQTLVRKMTVVGPEPGDLIDATVHGIAVVGRLEWLGTDYERFNELQDRRASFLLSGEPIPMKHLISATTPGSETAAIALIVENLDYLAKAILLAPLGTALLTLSQDGSPTHPFVLKLLCSERTDVSLALDVCSGRFVEVADLPIGDAVREHDFGILVHATDFAGVLRGDLQIWDIVGVAMWSWYEGPSFESPVAVMYAAYGEQIRPDIACKAYHAQLASIAAKRDLVN